MKVLKVIHGFPPDYMAGSEVYSYRLVQAMAKKVRLVCVFSRVENQFAPAYTVYDECLDGIRIRRINKPDRDYTFESKFHDGNIDKLFQNYVEEIMPDVVHFGHLSHLSTDLVNIISEKFRLPIVFTLHDFWLLCVKGQLINQNNERCDGPSVQKCFECSPYKTSKNSVRQELKFMRQLVDKVDVFLVPSHTVRNFFISHGIPKEKLLYSQYGFDKSRIPFKKRTYTTSSQVKFGFMGRIIPTKGIATLIDAFADIDANMFVYGGIDENRKRYLKHSNIHFMGAYNNDDVDSILQSIDVLVVPSIWLENAPLTIQEAFLAGVPVIASNIGGMKELVRDNVNGYLFQVGEPDALKDIVLRIQNNPEILNQLQSSRDDIRSIEDDVNFICNLYEQLCHK